MTPSALPATERHALEHWLRRFDETWDDGRLAKFIAALPPPGSPLRQAALLELVQLDLKHQWSRGRRPRVEGYLHSYPELGTAATAPPELILAECAVRQQHGSTIEEIDLDRRFPAQAGRVRDLLRARPGSGEKAATPPPQAADRATAADTPVAARELPEAFGHYRIVKKLGQ